MSTNKSHTTEVSQAELELLEAMRTAPALTQQVTDMLKGFEAETNKGMDAYQAELQAVAPSSEKPAPLLVVEIDGSMVPIVEYGEASEEQKLTGKKHDRKCFWKESRLCTVSWPGEPGTRYGVTDGTPFEAGCMMYQTCKYEGMDGDTHIHGVGDGAPWIADQYEEQFGANHKFYIDFYHVSEYVGDASKELKASQSVDAGWYDKQKEKLRASKASEVIDELGEMSDQEPDKEAVKDCLR